MGRRAGLMPGWCGNGLMLFLKYLEPGWPSLEPIGGGSGRVGGFWSFLANFGHFFFFVCSRPGWCGNCLMLFLKSIGVGFVGWI